MVLVPSETDPLVLAGQTSQYVINVAETVEVKPLRYSEVLKAAKEGYDAIRPDSVTRYLDDADKSPFHGPSEKLLLALTYADAVRRGAAIAVNGGEATLVYGVPGNNKPSSFFSALAPVVRMTQSKELNKRKKECGDAIKSLVESTFGAQVVDMLEIQALATSPRKQGHGYGTALVKFVNDLADAQGRAVYVITSDAYGFYETVGYMIVGERWLGLDNPEWHGDPVPIRLMLRVPSLDGVVSEKSTSREARISADAGDRAVTYIV